ncbi:hypothetical protein [Burkholderia sp. IMCC1007]|uniref:hypothetical protein n=1 Tax=Burkholderia sp. IMCC1007 TaxID=3004104 RepID=UPI0022B2E294|nr:hypothetical protein [Burkholderia sp. IMCC1007]
MITLSPHLRGAEHGALRAAGAQSDLVRSGLKHPDETVDHFLDNLEIYFYVISPRELDFQKV